MYKRRKGQGYIEIMVVVAVLLIITLFAIPRYQDLRRDAYRAQIANDSRLVETYTMEHYFYNGDMPVDSDTIDNSELKELVDSKKSYLKGDIINSTDIDEIGGEKYILDKEEVLKHVNTKLKGDFIYTDRGVIYVDNAKGSNSTEKPVDQTDLIKEIEDKIERLATTENKDEGYDLMDSIQKDINKIIDKGEQDRLTKDYEDALEEFLSKFLGRIKQISVGWEYAGVLTENGDLYTWGDGWKGKLGHGDNESRDEPTKVDNLSNVKQISLGRYHAAAITEDGDLYTWGNGGNGQLGHGDTDDKNVPTKVESISNVKQVALGDSDSHSAAITENGDLYTWGNGWLGQLGYGDKESRDVPTKVEYFKNKGLKVKQVALGNAHSAAITEDGDLYTWGFGRAGRLGHGDNNNRNEPTKVEYFKNKGLKVKQVALGMSHSAAITEDGALYTWGDGSYGMLGHGDNGDKNTPTRVKGISNVKQVALSPVHSVAITEDGDFYAWGKNTWGKDSFSELKDESISTIPIRIDKLSNNTIDVQLGENCALTINKHRDYDIYGTLEIMDNETDDDWE